MFDPQNSPGQTHYAPPNGVYLDPSLARTMIQVPRGGTYQQPPARQRSLRCLSLAALAFAAMLNLPRLQSLPPWQITGAAPPARVDAAAPLLATGTWEGRFGRGNDPALLVVETQTGKDSFEGVLVSRPESGGSYKVAVQGAVSPDGSVQLNETQTLSHPFMGGWALGTDTGSVGADGLSMSGLGRDTLGSHYSWSFQHVSTLAVVPQN